MGLRVLIGLVYTPFMLMKVGDSQYGVYSLSLSLISFISLLDLGFGQTMVRSTDSSSSCIPPSRSSR